jgi:CRP/FNR family transcriptional regulator, cyclic AMP receptor protein
MQTLEPIVAALPLFAGLKPEYVQLISGCAANVRYEAGEFLGREGEPADKFWIIRQGRVALEIHAPGRGPLTVQTIGDDDAVGWSWLVPPYQLRFDVHAINSTRALMFDGRCLRDKFSSDPELGFELIQRFSRLMLGRIEAMSLQLLDLYGEHHGEHE